MIALPWGKIINVLVLWTFWTLLGISMGINVPFILGVIATVLIFVT